MSTARLFDEAPTGTIIRTAWHRPSCDHAWQMAIGTIVLAGGWGWFEPQPIWTASFVACVVYSTMPAMGLAWILFYYTLRRMPAWPDWERWPHRS